MPLKCTLCDEVVGEDYRQARGHMKFKSGNGHGDQQEVPSDYKQYFEDVDESEGNDSDEDVDDSNESETESSDESDSGATDTDSSSSASSSSGSAGESTESNSSSSTTSRIRELLDTDLREVLG